MVLPRPTAFRGFASARFARTAARSSKPVQWQRVSRRGYASGGHGPVKASSDLPWLIGSVVVTIPSCWYLLQPNPSSSHGHGDAHGDGKHGEHEDHEEDDGHEESEGDEGVSEEQPEEQSEEHTEDSAPEKDAKDDAKEDGKDDSKDKGEDHSEKDDDSEDKSDDKEKPQMQNDKNKSNVGPGPSQDNDETKTVETPENSGSVEGVRFKGSTKAGNDDNSMGDTRQHIPDAKGGAKKRINSGYGIDLGRGSTEREDGSDKAVPAKTPKSMNEMSGKQAGLSNTSTKHSTDIANDPEKSKKGEGGPETAKTMGTVSVDRPQAESEDRGEENA
ncbi:hypothetical protein B0A49_09017 [Cryomyces minteri]|uniref:Uncharacterized protein n=1 Tax=Cryomyces minteri TaxID=331657 RepID=A0A4U0WP07_9PEZI|nr:hypothetical protein B0A49_09017 [Cryomyces minteri]